MNNLPEMYRFPEEDFYSLAKLQDGKYTGIKHKGLKDFDRGIVYVDNESLIMSEKKWTAFDLIAGVEICKERDFDRLYEKITNMWKEIKQRRSTNAYKDLVNIYNSVLNVLDPPTL